MNALMNLAEKAILPDRFIRLGIRHLDRKRLKEEDSGTPLARRIAKDALVGEMKSSPIAVHTRAANEQHYELPPSFFEKVLGKRLKYSGSFWPEGCRSLNEAEEAMLSIYARRAELEDGMDILELGSGWGSLSLWIAEHYQNSQITTVSNSRDQGNYIRDLSRRKRISNLQVVTADMNQFSTDRRFDRVVSVEMFEHMRNWEALLARVGRWLFDDGKAFIHVFSHRELAYIFDSRGDDNWMGRHFFTGGIMPSDDLIHFFQKDLEVEAHWRVDGTNYQKTAQAWLKNLDCHRTEILPILEEVYGREQAEVWFQRWRIFFMACAELWGFRKGNEWMVSHYRLRKPATGE